MSAAPALDAGSSGTVATMTAVVQHAYGEDPAAVLSIGELPVPVAGPGQVLVRVSASSVDRGTWHVMAGLPYVARAALGVRRPKWVNPGRNVAGTVAAVGAGVTGFAVGDAVFGTADSGFAQYAVAPVGRLAAAPAGLDQAVAATVPVSGLTALQAVRDRARVQPGQRVLVLGAAGGVGSFAVQIAHAAGAEVTGVCRGDKAELVRSLGADRVIDYRTESLPAERYDAILDTGGHRPLRELRAVLAERGTLVIVGSETDQRWRGGLGRPIRASLLAVFSRQRMGTFVASENAADLDVLREMIESGRLRPAVDAVYPMVDIASAIRHLLDGSVRGKIAVTI